jgi:hypothetical protein
MAADYRWQGQREFILSVGNPDAPKIIFVQPFFEEANRIRHILVNVMRAVASEGFCAVLPDLPGTGESLTPLSTVALADWRGALCAASMALGQPQMIASFRTGCLIDDAAGTPNVWRCAPETGARLVRDLMRTQITNKAEKSDGECIALAGNTLRLSLLEDLKGASPAVLTEARVARLATDAAEADVRLNGSPVWRRSEPGDDPELQTSMTNDIMLWAKSCVAS